jgi:hypothetical protein
MVIVSDILLPKNEDGILKVSDVHNSEEGDLSARTDITDPTTSTFIKTDAVGRLNILESNIEGAGADNSLNATEFAVSQMGAFDGSGYRVAKCSNVGRLEVDVNSGGGGDASAANQTNGNQKTQIFGIDPSNNQVQLSVENGGKAQVQVVGSNDINGGLPHRHLTIDANGRTLTNPIMTSTNNAIGTTNTLLNAGLPSALSSAGNLKVSLTEIEAGIINPINVASKHENAYLEIMSGSSVTIGNNILTDPHTLSAGASTSGGTVSPVTIYVHFGAGTSDSNFSLEVHKSYDGAVYFVDTNFTFSPVGSNTNSPPTVEPAMVSNGNSDGRFIKVKITNNSEANPTSVDVIVIERQ